MASQIEKVLSRIEEEIRTFEIIIEDACVQRHQKHLKEPIFLNNTIKIQKVQNKFQFYSHILPDIVDFL